MQACFMCFNYSLTFLSSKPLLSVLSTTSSEGHGIFQRCLYKAADFLHLSQWSIMVSQVRFTCLLLPPPPPPSISSSSSSSSIWTIFIYIFLLYAAMFADCSSENQPLQVKAVEECSFLYDGNKTINGTFATPGYPNTYPADTRCRFRFRGRRDQVVWILWSDFHLEGPLPYQRCLHDYVEVIIIDRQNVQHISGRYCGNKKPPDFKTMQRSVDIIFQSSFSKHFQGFSGVFMFINEREVQPPMSHYPGKSNPHSVGCGGFAQGIHGGVIKSPEYPEKYPENVECNWVIRVRPDKQIFIKILELQLTPGFRCEDAQLEVIDGYAHYNPNEEAALSQSQRVRFCGEEKYYREEGDKSYMSDRNRIHIRFKTSKPAPEQMKYKRQEFGSVIADCTSFYCRGGEYCIDEGKNICAERKRYCIENSLVCDGIPNCAEFDNSDEENCYSKELLVSGIFVLVLLIFVILSVVYWQRCHSRKQLDRLIHGRSLTSRRTMNEDISEKGDLIWQPKSDQCADSLNEILDNGPKKVTGEIKDNSTTMDDNACLQSGTYRRRKGYEEQNHVAPLTFHPNEHAAGVVVNFKSDIQLANNSDRLRSRIPPSSYSSSTYGYQPSAVWQQRTDLHQFTFAPTQLLVTSLSDETSADTESEPTNCTKKRIKKSLPVTSNFRQQQKSSRTRQNTVAQCSLYQSASCQPHACSSFAQEETKNPNNLKCILKSHSSSSSSFGCQQDRLAAEMVHPNEPKDDDDDDDDQLRCSNIKLQSQANAKQSTTNSSSKLKTSKQRVEFSDIVTVRIRPSDVSDEEEIEIDDHQMKTVDCPSNTNNINKTTTDDLGLKPTVV
ncbi:CUB domain-containing protein 2 [Trichinella nelsoni]|uniref:CUB domain-containing protein 2 n=1 Tax=Trichinella nelsoni TaxID=6336 RepID=A0A0V0S1U2_9BILA|nr:CUB domain-containing protein 2 [Trichinella nelsoni]